MKQMSNVKHLAVCFCIVLLITTFSSALVAQKTLTTDDVLSVVYSFEQPMLTKIYIDGTVYDRVTMPGASPGGNAGDPCLSSKGAYILLPYQKKPCEITVIPGEKISLGSGYVIEPVGTPVPVSQMSDAPHPVPDQNIYSSETPFPGDLSYEVGTQWFRGYQILVLKLNPVEYIPSTGELSYYKKLTISVKTVADTISNSLLRGLPEDRDEVLKMVDNPEVVGTYPEKIPSFFSKESYDLLIITTDELKDDFTRLTEFHDAEGTHTIIKTLMTDIPVSYDYRHTCINIRDCIRDAYTTFGIKYVLIGGDDDLVPDQDLHVVGAGSGTDHMPSDLYYSCLDGTYNYNEDPLWGEPTDGENGGDIDLIAEVYVGRACVGNSLETKHFIDKTIAYAQTNDVYLKESLMVGEYLQPDWGGDWMDELIDGCTKHGYTTVGIPSDQYNISKLYDQPGGYRWPVSALINCINNGTHFINHLGHSDAYYNMKMNNNNVLKLTNNNYCFIYSQGCSAGYFGNPPGYDDCIAEYFTIKTEHGAFAGVWNACYGWAMYDTTDGPSQRYHRQFWDAVFGENISIISKANQDSKQDNLYRINEDSGCMRYCYYELNFFGDPAVAFHRLKEIKISEVNAGFPGIVNAVIKNTGLENLMDIDWSITVKGGIFKLINVQSEGHIDALSVGETKSVTTDKLIFGLGKVNITVSVVSQDVNTITKTIEGFVLGPLVLLGER
jgi:hypothetical protein